MNAQSSLLKEMPVEQLLCSLNGRIGRWTYWDATLFFVLVGFLLFTVHWLLWAFWSIVTFWPSFAVMVKRWHDRGKSGWWMLVGLVPYLGWVWALVELGFIRGTIGPNRYGQDPLARCVEDHDQTVPSRACQDLSSEPPRRCSAQGRAAVQASTTQKMRPKGVTVIAWIIIVVGALGLLGGILGLLNPSSRQVLEGARVPMGVVMLFGFVASAIHLLCGVNMLEGLNWSRWLWLVANPLIVLVTVLIHGFDSQVANPASLVFTPAIYVAALVILLSKSASMFFKG